MNILLSGASGLIGSALRAVLTERGHHVIALQRASAPAPGAVATWNPAMGKIDLSRSGPLDAVVHLAGETIAQRWTTSAKERIRASRVDGTQLLCAALARLPQPPGTLVCASATGFFGDRKDELLDETSPPGTGFLAEVCQQWEAATAGAQQCGWRVAQLRLGVVLANQGGALAKMLPVFRWGLGGRLGNGQQYWSWIALEDLLEVINHALTHTELGGPINAVSPHPVTNREFTETLSATLRRPAVLPVPALAIRCLLGEMGTAALLASARVQPARLAQSGFVFRHPELGAALRHILSVVQTA